ncbi:MAG: hypothetical protein NTX49_01105 [Chlamydiae bacterium]|nr:hypothetical protein [Chlamydiota bacterium]
MVSNLITRAVSILLLIGASDLMAGNPASTQYVQQNSGSSSPAGQTYTIGEYAQGGVIFWLTLDSQHGLVASIENMPSLTGTTFQWTPIGASDTTIGATGNDISMGIGADGKPTTTGKINSALIVAEYSGSLSSTYAAGACNAYSVTVSGVTYDDWYLPSLAELGLMQSMQSTIDSVSVLHGGSSLGTNKYWSSFEAKTGNAWSQDFSNANQASTSSSVRCACVQSGLFNHLTI